jgi:hypothetical protein
MGESVGAPLTKIAPGDFVEPTRDYSSLPVLQNTSLYFALRACLRQFKIVPDDFVKTGVFDRHGWRECRFCRSKNLPTALGNCSCVALPPASVQSYHPSGFYSSESQLPGEGRIIPEILRYQNLGATTIL